MISTRRLVAAVVLMSAACSAYAQFSLIPRNAPRPDGGDPRGRRAEGPDNAQYEYGREVYAVKLACSGCPLGDLPLDEKTARRYLGDEQLRFSLSRKEDEAVTAFLTQMFALQAN